MGKEGCIFSLADVRFAVHGTSVRDLIGYEQAKTAGSVAGDFFIFMTRRPPQIPRPPDTFIIQREERITTACLFLLVTKPFPNLFTVHIARFETGKKERKQNGRRVRAASVPKFHFRHSTACSVCVFFLPFPSVWIGYTSIPHTEIHSVRGGGDPPHSTAPCRPGVRCARDCVGARRVRLCSCQRFALQSPAGGCREREGA